MNGRKVPWFIWLFAGIVLLNVLGGEGRPSVLPLLIFGFIMFTMLGRRSRVSSGPQRTGQVGRDETSRRAPLPDAHDTWTPPTQDTSMPTIDVPRYPGEGQAAPPPPPGRVIGVTGAQPSHGAGMEPGPLPTAGAPHTSTDPVVSLGQLHLSRCGRDLQLAARNGTATEVARVLDEVRDLSRRMQDMLGAAEGTPGSGRREFAAGLRALDRLVVEARGEHPPGAKLTRVTQACLRLGQTGRHE